LVVAGLILYIPANILPVMIMTVAGDVAPLTVMGGVQELYTPGVTTNRFQLDDYSTVNLRAGLDFGRYQLSVFANNAFDESYRVLVSSTAARWNQPRTTGFELRADF
jgi:outer membrane receptor protein involved in Fe transport